MRPKKYIESTRQINIRIPASKVEEIRALIYEHLKQYESTKVAKVRIKQAKHLNSQPKETNIDTAEMHPTLAKWQQDAIDRMKRYKPNQ